MVVIQARPRRKASGGLYRSTLSKRTHMLGRAPSLTKVGAVRTKQVSTKGGGKKDRLLGVDVANLYDPKTKKHTTAKIQTVKDSPANRNFVRRNIITKGAIIVTDKGDARVTSRPGQEGAINAVLI